MSVALRAALRLVGRAGLLAGLAVLPLGVLVAPAQAASVRPTLSASVTVSPPSAPTEPLLCDYDRVNCGFVTVESILTDIEALPVGDFGASLSGTAHLRRVYGCANAAGRRLHRYDTVVEQDVVLNTRRGSPIPIEPGRPFVVVDDFAFFDDSQPGTCPAGRTPFLYRIAVSRIRLDLETLDQTAHEVFRYRVPGTYSWAGAVSTEPVPATT